MFFLLLCLLSIAVGIWTASVFTWIDGVVVGLMTVYASILVFVFLAKTMDGTRRHPFGMGATRTRWGTFWSDVSPIIGFAAGLIIWHVANGDYAAPSHTYSVRISPSTSLMPAHQKEGKTVALTVAVTNNQDAIPHLLVAVDNLRAWTVTSAWSLDQDDRVRALLGKSSLLSPVHKRVVRRVIPPTDANQFTDSWIWDLGPLPKDGTRELKVTLVPRATGHRSVSVSEYANLDDNGVPADELLTIEPQTWNGTIAR